MTITDSGAHECGAELAKWNTPARSENLVFRNAAATSFRQVLLGTRLTPPSETNRF
jgi:hypothetical protein